MFFQWLFTSFLFCSIRICYYNYYVHVQLFNNYHIFHFLRHPLFFSGIIPLFAQNSINILFVVNKYLSCFSHILFFYYLLACNIFIILFLWICCRGKMIIIKCIICKLSFQAKCFAEYMKHNLVITCTIKYLYSLIYCIVKFDIVTCFSIH